MQDQPITYLATRVERLARRRLLLARSLTPSRRFQPHPSTKIAPLEPIRQLRVPDPHLVQNRGVHVTELSGSAFSAAPPADSYAVGFTGIQLFITVAVGAAGQVQPRTRPPFAVRSAACRDGEPRGEWDLGPPCLEQCDRRHAHLYSAIPRRCVLLHADFRLGHRNRALTVSPAPLPRLPMPW